MRQNNDYTVRAFWCLKQQIPGRHSGINMTDTNECINFENSNYDKNIPSLNTNVANSNRESEKWKTQLKTQVNS